MIQEFNSQDIQPQSVREIAIQKILEYIKEADLEPGDQLPSENEFMEKMGIGRSTIREVLHSLVALGVLESKPGKGYFLKRLNVFSFPWDSGLAQILVEDKDILDLLEVREVLEKRIVALAVQRATEEDISKLEEIMDESRRAAREGDNISDTTIRFHRYLARTTKNPIFVQLLEKMVPLIVSKAQELKLPPEEDIELHEEAVQALKERDKEELQQWVERHLNYVREKIGDSDD